MFAGTRVLQACLNKFQAGTAILDDLTPGAHPNLDEIVVTLVEHPRGFPRLDSLLLRLRTDGVTNQPEAPPCIRILEALIVDHRERVITYLLKLR